MFRAAAQTAEAVRERRRRRAVAQQVSLLARGRSGVPASSPYASAHARTKLVNKENISPGGASSRATNRRPDLKDDIDLPKFSNELSPTASRPRPLHPTPIHPERSHSRTLHPAHPAHPSHRGLFSQSSPRRKMPTPMPVPSTRRERGWDSSRSLRLVRAAGVEFDSARSLRVNTNKLDFDSASSRSLRLKSPEFDTSSSRSLRLARTEFDSGSLKNWRASATRQQSTDFDSMSHSASSSRNLRLARRQKAYEAAFVKGLATRHDKKKSVTFSEQSDVLAAASELTSEASVSDTEDTERAVTVPPADTALPQPVDDGATGPVFETHAQPVAIVT